MITSKRNKDCVTFHLSYLIPEGSRVLPLLLRYASLAFRTLSLLDLMSTSGISAMSLAEWSFVSVLRLWHLEICLSTDYLPRSLFSFRLPFKIILFLYCRHKMKNNYSNYQVSFSVFSKLNVDLVFRWGKSRKRIHRWLRLWQFMQAITADYKKNLLTFEIFNYSRSSTAATKWNTAAIKILPLFEDGLFIWFWGEDSTQNSTKVKVEHADFLQQSTRKNSWPRSRFTKLWKLILNTIIGLIHHSGRIPFRRKNWAINKNCELEAACCK